MKSFIKRVDIYPQQQDNGGILKHIEFKFPVWYDGKQCDEFSWDKLNHVECVVLLAKVP